MKRLAVFILIICLCGPMCGCYDNQEIDRTAYVIAIGIDKAEEKYNYTFQISAPLAMSSGGEVSAPEGEEKDNRVQNIIIGASDLYDARNKLNNFLSKDVNLSHLKMIAFSMESAKEGISPHMTFLLREREVRPNTRLCVSENKAEEFLKGITPALEANTAEYYDSIAENGSIYAPSKTLREFVNEESVFASTLPIGKVSDFKDSGEFSNEGNIPLRVSSSKSEFSGLCLIKDRRAVGTLSPLLSGLYGLIMGETENMDISIEKGGKWHMVRLSPQGKAIFQVNQTEGGDRINMRIGFAAEINSVNGELTEKDVEDYLCKELYALFIKSRDMGCDIFRAGNYLRRSCRTISEWEELDWNNRFCEAYFMPYISVFAERSNSGTM